MTGVQTCALPICFPVTIGCVCVCVCVVDGDAGGFHGWLLLMGWDGFHTLSMLYLYTIYALTIYHPGRIGGAPLLLDGCDRWLNGVRANLPNLSE